MWPRMSGSPPAAPPDPGARTTAPYPTARTRGGTTTGSTGVADVEGPRKDAMGDLRGFWRGLVDIVRSPGPIPRGGPRERFTYGLAQPFVGVRVMLRDQTILGESLAPVLLLAAVCTLVALQTDDLRASSGMSSGFYFLALFFGTFVAMAPIPPFLFARLYARIAARGRTLLGFGPREPYIKGWGRAAGETLAQTIIIAIGVVPITLVVGAITELGALWAWVIQAGWTLHWMVVEALDNGRTLRPGTTVAAVECEETAARGSPWFVRGVARVKQPWARTLLTPLRMLGEIIESLGRTWSREIAIVEREPALAAGVGAGVVLLLAVPGLNLLFRPAVAIGAAHLRARLDEYDR